MVGIAFQPGAYQPIAYQTGLPVFQFWYANLLVIAQEGGVQPNITTIVAQSECFVTAAYFAFSLTPFSVTQTQDVPFVPSQVQYRVDEPYTGAAILPWTTITPAFENQVLITQQQNTMISLSRQSEQRQVTFSITDGFGEVFYERIYYTLVQLVGVQS